MELNSWNPLREMDALLNRFGRPLARPGGFGSASAGFDWMPSVDISESDKEYLVKAELPGVSKEDIDISIENGLLTISGERKSEHEETEAKIHRVERFYGHFQRQFSLPDDVAVDEIRAQTKNGLLTLHLPRSQIEKTSSRKVEIS